MADVKDEKRSSSEQEQNNHGNENNAAIQSTGTDADVGTVDGKSIAVERIEYPEGSPEAYYRNFEPIAALNLPDWQATERALVRRLDWTLLPTVWILYLNNYLDRTNIAQARLNTFDEDLGLRGDDYNNAVAVLTIGYMLFQLPSNMLLTRVRPGLYLPLTAIVWSGVSAATAGVRNSQQLIVVRFFLGCLEAPLFPGVSRPIS